MDFDRPDFEIPLARADARVLVRRGGRPVDRYAAMLQVLRGGVWRTIRLIDNHLDRHHMHRYDRDVKLEPEPFAAGSVNEAIPAGIRYLRDTAASIIESWDRYT